MFIPRAHQVVSKWASLLRYAHLHIVHLVQPFAFSESLILFVGPTKKKSIYLPLQILKRKSLKTDYLINHLKQIIFKNDINQE
jgi:hypothetical protein